MLTINLICVGGLKEKFFKEAQDEYVKRLGRFCKIIVTEVKTAESLSVSIDKQKDMESENLFLARRGKCICFDRRGKKVDSEQFARMLQGLMIDGVSEISFLIGGSYGLSEKLLKETDMSISFGDITLPHTLFRVVALEQIYRAFTILNNSSYHK